VDRQTALTGTTTIIRTLALHMATMGRTGLPVAYLLAPVRGTRGTGAVVGAAGAGVADMAGVVVDITDVASLVMAMAMAMAMVAVMATDAAAMGEAQVSAAGTAFMAEAVSTAVDFTVEVVGFTAEAASMVAVEGMAAGIANAPC